MRKLAMILFLSPWGMVSVGQNLVPNSSFEGYNRLPCHFNVYFIQDLLKDWVQPLPTTTDYWHTAIDPICFLNPENISTSPRTGNGMVGIIAADLQSGNKVEYREYVGVKLTSALEEGSFYHVEYYAMNAQINANIDNMRSNNLGAAFTKSQILLYPDNNPPDHLSLKTQIKAKYVIDDQWQPVSGCFIADSAYQHIVIGNFEPIESTELVRLTFNNSNGNAIAYYFIDDVSVRPLPYDLSHLAKSVTFCHDQPSVELNATTSGATAYRWEDGSSAPVLLVSARETRDYAVEIFFNECSYTHMFSLNYVPQVSIGSDTLICNNETLVLRPSHPTKSFLWSDGSTDTVKRISTAGTYSLKVLEEACVVADTIHVDYIDCPGFLPNIVTMNEDDLNDKLTFENIDHLIWSLEIFNRWGERIFFSGHYRNDWDGKDVAEGVYYYKLTCRELNKVVKGWVQTIR